MWVIPGSLQTPTGWKLPNDHYERQQLHAIDLNVSQREPIFNQKCQLLYIRFDLRRGTGNSQGQVLWQGISAPRKVGF